MSLTSTQEHHLDYDRLLDASDYKERYRADMIRWGEDRRRADPGFFARVIASGPGSEMPVWLISDARRQSDVAHFRQSYTDGTLVVTVRVTASEATRRARGWVFTAGEYSLRTSLCTHALYTGRLAQQIIVNNYQRRNRITFILVRGSLAMLLVPKINTAVIILLNTSLR